MHEIPTPPDDRKTRPHQNRETDGNRALQDDRRWIASRPLPAWKAILITVLSGVATTEALKAIDLLSELFHHLRIPLTGWWAP